MGRHGNNPNYIATENFHLKLSVTIWIKKVTLNFICQLMELIAIDVLSCIIDYLPVSIEAAESLVKTPLLRTSF